jgi:hypothetical protein
MIDQQQLVGMVYKACCCSALKQQSESRKMLIIAKKIRVFMLNNGKREKNEKCEPKNERKEMNDLCRTNCEQCIAHFASEFIEKRNENTFDDDDE